MEYEEMLDRAYSQLPDKVKKSERFEVPVTDSFQQGNKTIIRNFSFIAQKLKREPQLLAKYMSRELAAPGEIAGQSFVLQGKFNPRVLNERVNSFVEDFVFCKECKKPDTKLLDVERGVKLLVCEACGARSPVRMT